METKLNIAEILKDKPKGTKLHSPLFGKCTFLRIDDPLIEVLHHADNVSTFYSDGAYFNCAESEPLLFPSKEMRDWSKFAWKKGDVLVNNDGNTHIIFKGFSSDNYTTFEGKHYLWKKSNEVNYFKEETKMKTSVFDKASDDEAQTYINTIEERFGGKLNLETLEIEKSAFKDGDILCVIDNSNDYHYILIYKSQDDKHIHRYVTMFEDNSLNIKKDSYLTKPEDYSTHYATDEEKQQLIAALEKENKAWDAEKKQIVDLKPKVEFKPFDKVIVRCSEADKWSIDFFSYKTSNRYICTGDSWFAYCLPYNEETAKLIGTKNNVEG